MRNPEQQGWTYTMCRRAGIIALGIATLLVPVIMASQSARAQTLTTLYTFKGKMDGGSPVYGTLLRGGNGNLYGTTSGGGAYRNGTIFNLDPNTGSPKIRYNFTGGADGGQPWYGLVRDASQNLYGTTITGGDFGWGTIFKLDPAGTMTVLHSFGDMEAYGSRGPLILDAAGNIYGVTSFIAYKLDPSGVLTILHTFNGYGGAPNTPNGGLMRDTAGNLYGTLRWGGNVGCPADTYGCGGVYKLAADGTYTVLHVFAGGAADRAEPLSGLVRDSEGNLYGTTLWGGSWGGGVIFKLDANDGFTVLHSFALSGGYDPYASLLRDPSGNLYGTTYTNGTTGPGTVFKLDTNGNFVTLYTFDDGNVAAALTGDSSGNLYGTTTNGGAYKSGTVFEISPQ